MRLLKNGNSAETRNVMFRNTIVARIIEPIRFARINICLIVLAVAVTGCTARITHIVDLGDYTEYEAFFTSRDIPLGVAVYEKPLAQGIFVSRPFKSIGLLVVNIKVSKEWRRAI